MSLLIDGVDQNPVSPLSPGGRLIVPAEAPTVGGIGGLASVVYAYSRVGLTNTPTFKSIIGISGSSTESDVQIEMTFAGNLKNVRIPVTANTLANASVFTLRKNGAGTLLIVNVPAGTTGVFVNTSDVVSYAATDLLNWEFTIPLGAGGSITHFLQVENTT